MKRQDYFEKKELVKKSKVDAGVMSNRFPNVSEIVIQMTYNRKLSNPVHMMRTINYFPSSYAYFHMDCVMKDCVNGGVDLTPVIGSLIKKHKTSFRGKVACNGQECSLAHNSGISYEVSVHYGK